MTDDGVLTTFVALAGLFGIKVATDGIRGQRDGGIREEPEPTLYEPTEEDLIPPPIEQQGVVIRFDDERERRRRP